MHFGRLPLLLAAAALLAALGAGGNPAFAALIDYVGFAWESGGIASSDAGDELEAVAVATVLDPLFAVDLSQSEATLHLKDLISTGGILDPMTGWTYIIYAGGSLEVFADPAQNHDWGINPPNASAPSSFRDGELIFAGAFTSFTLTLASHGAGAFEGVLDGVGGSALAGPCSGCAYSFAGTFTSQVGAQIPDGYDLQIDGQLEVDSAISNQDSGWGSLKLRYQ